MPNPFPKHCHNCGADHDHESWAELPCLGIQDGAGGPDLEVRNCACGSTLMVSVQALAEVSDG